MANRESWGAVLFLAALLAGAVFLFSGLYAPVRSGRAYSCPSGAPLTSPACPGTWAAPRRAFPDRPRR